MIIYLYIKQHSVTNLKYFGKTISNPFKYNGSGKLWKKHIKKYGKEHIKTLEVWSFDNQEMCTNFALKFSVDNNIVESKEWANIVPEKGKDGGNSIGRKCSLKTRRKMSQNRPKGPSGKKWFNNGIIESFDLPENKPENFKFGRLYKSSEETKLKISKLFKGKKLSKEAITKRSKARTKSLKVYFNNGQVKDFESRKEFSKSLGFTPNYGSRLLKLQHRLKKFDIDKIILVW